VDEQKRRRGEVDIVDDCTVDTFDRHFGSVLWRWVQDNR